MARGGTGLVILLAGAAALALTPAGPWLHARMMQLDDACYAGVSQMEQPSLAPVCTGLSNGLGAMDRWLSQADQQLSSLWQRVAGNTGNAGLNQLVGQVRDQAKALTSPSQDLLAFRYQGPSAVLNARQSPLQTAVNYFAIGQDLRSHAGAEKALPWLQQGAQQPQGFGVMSQLALGDLYLKGGKGVPQNPVLAHYYLTQASGSIDVLNAAKSPQARQMLSALPGGPAQMQTTIAGIISEIQRGNP